MSDLTLNIEYRALSECRPNPRNARSHPDKQIAQIAASIDKFGFTNPLLIDEEGVLIAGHGRHAAAQQLGLQIVPVIVVAHLTPDQKRALMIADNKIGLNAGWDIAILRNELIELSNVAELDFDVSLTGFDTAEIDVVIDPAAEPRRDPVDTVAAIDRSVPPVVNAGDLFILGNHRILCGSALEASSFDVLMAGELAQQVITDPPYNVPIDGHVSGLGKQSHAEFAMAAGEMSSPQFTGFLKTALKNSTAYSEDGAIVVSFMDWRHCKELIDAGDAAGMTLKNICVWDKIGAGMGSLYRSQHEFAFIFKSGTAPHINNIELGKHGRYRTNVWRYAGANMFRRGRKKDLETHPTVKPIAMIVDAIKDCSNRGGIILDPFGGSGTTLLAAERTGRKARLIEIDPYYVDAAIRRWQEMTGKSAVNALSGLPFDGVDDNASTVGAV